MSTANNIPQSDNPLIAQQKTNKRKQIFTSKDVVRYGTYIVLSICLIISSTLMPHTMHHSPTPIEEIVEETQAPVEHVNQMGGAFQAGVDEYDYEEVITTVRYQPSETLFIGGPRVKALGQKILTDAEFFTTENATVEWLKDDAEFILEEITDKKLCIVSLGLADLSGAMQYAQILNSWTIKFPEISFVFVNLGPVDETLYKDATNAKIQNYNNSIKSLLNENWRYINLYGYLAENGIEAEDGVNYSETLNTTLFTWILQQADTEERVEYVPIIPEGSSD